MRKRRPKEISIHHSLSYVSNGKKYFVAAAEDQQWRVYAAVPYLTICGQPNESRPVVRSFAQQGGLIHLHGIPLNVAEKSNEARTQVVHYSSAESGTHTLAGHSTILSLEID